MEGKYRKKMFCKLRVIAQFRKGEIEFTLRIIQNDLVVKSLISCFREHIKDRLLCSGTKHMGGTGKEKVLIFSSVRKIKVTM